MREITKRGFSDTAKFFGWERRLLFIGLVSVLAGTALHYFDTGSFVGPKEELMLLAMYTLAPAGALALILLVYNLACAPYRIEKEKRIDYQNRYEVITHEKGGLSLFIENRDSFSLGEAACIIAGEPITKGEVNGVAAGYLRDLESAAMDGSLSTLQPVPAMHRRLLRASVANTLKNILHDPVIPSMLNVEISKDELIRFAVEKYKNLPSVLTG